MTYNSEFFQGGCHVECGLQDYDILYFLEWLSTLQRNLLSLSAPKIKATVSSETMVSARKHEAVFL